MDKKDVILITAHTPDQTRKKLLLDLIGTINRQKFDVVISANSKLPKKVYDICNYVIYNQENKLLTDFKYKFSLAWRNDSFHISTTEVKQFNHILAAGSLIFNGIKFCKSLGYEKLHFLEYDSIILNDKILEENSVKLDTHPIVWYNHPANLGIYSSYSLNIKMLTDVWTNYFENNVDRYLNENNCKILEEFSKELFLNVENAYQEDLQKYNECVKTNLFNTDDNDDWVVVLSDGIDVYSFVLGLDKFDRDVDTFFVINNKNILNIKMSNNVWKLNRIGNINEIHNIKIFIDKTLQKEYDFNVIDKKYFFSLNCIKFTNNE